MKKTSLLILTLTALVPTSCGGNAENVKAQEMLDKVIECGKDFKDTTDAVHVQYDNLSFSTKVSYTVEEVKQSIEIDVSSASSFTPCVDLSIDGLKGEYTDIISSGSVYAKIDSGTMLSIPTSFDYYTNNEKLYCHVKNKDLFTLVNVMLRALLNKEIVYPENCKFYIDKTSISGDIDSEISDIDFPDIDLSDLSSIIELLPLPTSWKEYEDGSYETTFNVDKNFLASLIAEEKLVAEGKTHKDVTPEEWKKLVEDELAALNDLEISLFSIVISIDGDGKFSYIEFKEYVTAKTDYQGYNADISTYTSYTMNFVEFNDDVEIKVPTDLDQYGTISVVDVPNN